jgi:hypothetical protein
MTSHINTGTKCLAVSVLVLLVRRVLQQLVLQLCRVLVVLG